MYIENISLKNYRNIKNIEFSPKKKINVIYGKNAQGKTNILEAIYILANLKSFRGTKNEELIKHNENYSCIKATVYSKLVKREIKVIIEKKSKNVKIDNKKPESSSDFFGYLRPVLFSPDENFLLKGSPSEKRILLDRAIFQASPVFLNRLLEYNRFLKQRNRLLKEGKKQTEQQPWTEGLVSAGSHLRFERQQYLKRILPIFKEVFEKISDGIETADILYPSAHRSKKELEEEFYLELRKTEERELIMGQTITGPHRDDPTFLINGYPIRQYGSQGQQKSFMLAFKIAQIIDLEKLLGQPPVLLLDDITSELDSFRKKFFFDFLKDCNGQVFLTTTEKKFFFNKEIEKYQSFLVTKGTIQEISAAEDFI
jgi:DNA replication and repair protein RecF